MPDDRLDVGDIVGPFGLVGQYLEYIPRRCLCVRWTCDCCLWFRGAPEEFAESFDAADRRVADRLAGDGVVTAQEIGR